MYARNLYVLLRALICLQQVSGRVVTRDDASISRVADDASIPACPGSGLHARDGEDDDCQEELDELAMSDNPIEEADLIKLERGDFTGLNCVAILEAAYFLYDIHTSKLKKTLGRRADGANDPTADCQRARDLVAKQNVPEPCKKIRDIEIGITMASSWIPGEEGTKDDVGATLEGPAGKAEVLLGSGLQKGESKWVKVDMQKYYKSDFVDIGGINNLNITAEAWWWTNGGSSTDQFKIQDLRLRAKCADPEFSTSDDKYLGLNKWYGRPQKGWWIFSNFYPSNNDKATVATLPVIPADWEFAPPCASFKELSYDFAFGNTNGGGTGDTLVLKLGEGKIPLGSSFSAGTSTKGSVDLQKTFNKKVVSLGELKTVAFDDDDSSAGFGDNGWTFQGVTFTATCADVPKKMQMNKYSNVNTDIYAAGNKMPWSGALVPSDWTEIRA